MIKGTNLKRKISIDIYSDTICPWCYIGLNKLKSAISEFLYCDFNLIWRPFQLNPDMPKQGLDREKYLRKKFNGIETANKIYQSINEEGLKNNIHFQFNKIITTPNSFASHKLLAIAHSFDKQTETVESLFYDYFIEGIDIGNYEELIKIAKLHNIYDENTLNYIKSNKDDANLLAEAKYARDLGVKGVPCYIINKEFVLYGAQDKKVFLDIFKKIHCDY